MKRLALCASLVLACGTDPGECPYYRFASQFDYKTNFNQTTTSGIKLDVSGQDVTPEFVDRITKEAEDCLAKNFPDGTIPDDVLAVSQCQDNKIHLPFNRDCFQVKIPNDWMLSCDGKQQLLPSLAPNQLCEDKGLTPTAGCPCRWRAGLQDNHIVVATPSLYLYKDALLRLNTGCNAIWVHPKFAECAQPTVPPL